LSRNIAQVFDLQAVENTVTIYATAEVFMAMSTKIAAFWDLTVWIL
jgi:hypothetical protein